ncbi:MAG: FecR domain-containing protein [Pigmentiphaga sp.]|nr:FecR domain-containing protein [Pigmentiphaga sp.]
MNRHIKDYYKKFLYGDISYVEFMEMRHYMNDITDEDLSEVMSHEWNENILSGGMDNEAKDAIRSKLNFYVDYDKSKIRRNGLLKVAVVLLPLIVIGTVFMYALFSREDPDNMIFSVERGNKAVVTLPDQTKVWLNANSTIEFSQANKKERRVTLTGEAFFKVTKEKTKPFIVKMDELEVEVLGTSFNAKARAYSDIIETSLVEGSIKLRSNNLSQDYYLQPNEKAVFSKTSHRILITHTDNELETAWMYNRLKFSSERFADVLTRLEDWYGVSIINHCQDINNDLISGTFREEKIESALQALKIQYQNIQFRRQKDTIIIYRN